ncbi:heavy-metal-associated domain-containing protein [Methylobacterium sp. P5_C11]
MIRFKVDTMECGGCAKAVTRAVEAIEPGARVTVDLETKRVTVSGAVGTAERIAHAIASAGYPAEPLRAAA